MLSFYFFLHCLSCVCQLLLKIMMMMVMMMMKLMYSVILYIASHTTVHPKLMITGGQ